MLIIIFYFLFFLLDNIVEECFYKTLLYAELLGNANVGKIYNAALKSP